MPRPSSKDSSTALPVFFDPTRHRWLAIRSLSAVWLACMLVLFTLLFVRILDGPHLAGFSLSSPDGRVVVTQPDMLKVVPPASPTALAPGIAADASGFFPLSEPPADHTLLAAGSRQ